VDRPLVLVDLVALDAVWRHQGAVRVALAAGVHDVGRVHRGTAVADLTHAVRAVTRRADRDVRVPLGERLSVLGGPVLLQLVGRNVGRVTQHEGGVGVARAAHVRDRLMGELAHEAPGGAHRDRGILGCRIAAVTAGTRDPLGVVDVAVRELGGGPQAGIVETHVTRRARILRVLSRRTHGVGRGRGLGPAGPDHEEGGGSEHVVSHLNTPANDASVKQTM
jgi:hypothetical protein